MNSLEDSSLEECKRAIEEEPFLAAYYELGEKYIKSRDGRIWFTFVGLDRNIASIKSKGRILLLWVDEAEPVTDEAWDVVIPTLREEGSDWNAELWVTWNPRRKTAAVEKRFRQSSNPLCKVVSLNWKDNPKFPALLERTRLNDQRERPDQYDHVWEGGYLSVMVGAYFAQHITQAKAEGRIGRVAADPLLTIRLFADIGGTGAKADNFVFCIAGQRTKSRIHCNQGIVWLSGVADDGCDGAKADRIQNWMTRGSAWLRIQIRFHFHGRCRKNINVATVPSKRRSDSNGAC
jgi:phage terminase large subunit